MYFPQKLTIGLLTFASALVLPLSAQSQTSRTFDIDGFNKLNAQAGVRVIFEKADTFLITAEYEMDGDDTLHVHRRGKMLLVTRKNKNGWEDALGRITVKINGPNLSYIEASSGASIQAINLDAIHLKIRTVSGGSLQATGECGSLDIKSESGGIGNLAEVVCDQVIAKAYSGGRLKVNASKQVKTRTDSGGTIIVYGSPKTRDINSAIGDGGQTTFQDTP